MKTNQPYQPLLLRILHGFTGIALIAAMVTAYWTYDTFDGRWLKLPLPEYREIESIHGTFGLYTLIIFPVFAIYAFRRGNKRLIQSDSLNKLIAIDAKNGYLYQIALDTGHTTVINSHRWQEFVGTTGLAIDDQNNLWFTTRENLYCCTLEDFTPKFFTRLPYTANGVAVTANTKEDISKLVETLKSYTLNLIVLEATGG